MQSWKRLTVLVFVALILVGCGDSVSWHQKVTITVDTPSGLKSASTVVEILKEERGGGLAPREATGIWSHVKGEAAILDLADGKYLFLLLKDMQKLANSVFRDKMAPDGKRRPKWPKWAHNIANAKGVREIAPEHYPMLVTFEYIAKPETVKEVDPSNIAAAFGSDYALKSITLEVTDEPLTRGRVAKVLGWLDVHKGRLRPPSLRLGEGPHPARSVFTVEKLIRLDFLRK